MLKILISLFIISIFPLYSFAQQDTPISEVKAAEIDQLNQQEEERTKEIANLLGFTLPQYTDNPSYVITFKDPSKSQKGVEISLDGKNFATIKSPYTFPALSIGDHLVKFRFYDSTDTIKVLEYELIVIPRAPIAATPEFDESSISISGTALANSDVLYTISANAFNTKGIVTTDENGSWSIKITPEGGVSDGIYTFTSLTRKYGYTSTLSDSLTFSVGDNQLDSDSETKKDIFFSFNSITKENILDTVKNNRDLAILVGIAFLVGIILTSIFKNIAYSTKSEKEIKKVETLISKKDTKEKDTKTLREIFGGEKEETKVIEEEKPVLEEEKKVESIINKDVFLKRFKSFDPDNDDGKEKNKKVKISLTSKEE